MSIIVSLALASATVDLTSQYQREWQICLTETSKLWANKPGPPIGVVDSATIYCSEKLERLLIVSDDKAKKLGLNDMQSKEYNAIVIGVLLTMNRQFAIEAVERARRK